ncbi:MAG: UDP-N-acetylmuramoyl-tripeptide--D-alanyl-D-alanine ligase [Coriobacteriia bacterium]|nr:UDP-N-acetylmuramoyl-tripeptide--D-alanyl-D-alanine ligase [Coriobacteriia bacterium]
MLTLPVSQLIDITGGSLLNDQSVDTMVNGISIDSRGIEPGNAFFAFRGTAVDAHDLLADAISLGARALVVTRRASELARVLDYACQRDVAVVQVADTLEAIQRLASYHRSRLFCPVIGVTGSTGKTTTKDFITSVLGIAARVVSTEGNQNNELGVPLTLLRAGADTDVLVVEMAMRGEGQISALARIARPTVGLITNIGTSHIEVLGSQDAIARAKGELVRAIPADGMVFLNGDDGYTELIAQGLEAPVTRYGLGDDNAVRADGIELDDESRPTFELVTPGFRRCVAVNVPGRHNVYNALAAAAVAVHLGMNSEDIARGLRDATPGDMRMQSFISATGVHVINDAYNANPTSMRAAIETLSGMTAGSRRIAVLGDMAELGSLTELAHFRIGEEVARLNIDVLVTVGERARRIADGARAEGMDGSCIRPCATADEGSEVLDDLVRAGDVVLVKASRVMGLERVVEGIVTPRV